MYSLFTRGLILRRIKKKSKIKMYLIIKMLKKKSKAKLKSFMYKSLCQLKGLSKSKEGSKLFFFVFHPLIIFISNALNCNSYDD